MSTLVFRYRLAAPHEGADVVADQMRLAHKYRNTLTEIENARRSALREAESQFGTMASLLVALRAAEDKLLAALAALKRSRASTKRRSETALETAAVKSARANKKDALAAVRLERARLAERCAECRKADEDADEEPVGACPHATDDAIAFAAERARIGDLTGALRRGARAICGLGSEGPYFGAWGTYLLVEAAADQAAKTTEMYGRGGEPLNVRFSRWDGSGEVGVQIQGGASIEDVTDGDCARLSVTVPPGEPRPGAAWVSAPRCMRKRASKCGELAMRLSERNDVVDWGRWRLDMFRRPLPAGTTVKRATVHRVPVGPHYEWYVTLTLAGAPGIAAKPSDGIVAVDVGWRVMGDEIRVATWRDTDGGHGDLRLTADDVRLLRAPQAIRSVRDGRMEGVKQRLDTWFAQCANLPVWLAPIAPKISWWRSPARFVGLYNRWKDARFHGDDIAFSDLEAFCNQDRRAWATEAKWRSAAIRRRRERYRIFAAGLGGTYGTLVIEADSQSSKPFDMTPLVITPDAEADAQNETARSNRFLVATYQLRQALLNAFRRRDRVVGLIPAADTTRTCHVCGLVETRDAAASVVLACECGATWDQDDNADVILLRRWCERTGNDGNAGSSRVPEKDSANKEVGGSTWAKRRRRGAARRAARDSARDVPRKAAG